MSHVTLHAARLIHISRSRLKWPATLIRIIVTVDFQNKDPLPIIRNTDILGLTEVCRTTHTYALFGHGSDRNGISESFFEKRDHARAHQLLLRHVDDFITSRECVTNKTKLRGLFWKRTLPIRLTFVSRSCMGKKCYRLSHCWDCVVCFFLIFRNYVTDTSRDRQINTLRISQN